MEDALISPAGFMILSGAGLIEADEQTKIKVHTIEQTNKVEVNELDKTVTITLQEKPYWDAKDPSVYVMLMNNGEAVSEPYIPDVEGMKNLIQEDPENKKIILRTSDDLTGAKSWTEKFETEGVVLVDYYVERTSGVSQIEITPDKFGGNYYVEASTLFRDTNGVDMPAEFIIPNCKIQSNFTFTMASSGDPSTFTFTMDAFPDYTRFDNTKKVLAAIQIISETSTETALTRPRTQSDDEYNENTGRIEAGPTNSEKAETGTESEAGF